MLSAKFVAAMLASQFEACVVLAFGSVALAAAAPLPLRLTL